jgi:hypothetical protein
VTTATFPSNPKSIHVSSLVLQDGTALPRRTLARAFAPTIINAEMISAIYPNNIQRGNKAR